MPDELDTYTSIHTDAIAVIEPYRGEAWADLVGQSQTVFGADLEKGDVLIGIPFVLVRTTFRPGDYLHGKYKDKMLIPGTGCGAAHPYVSMDVITGSQAEFDRALRRGRITDEQAANIDPEEHLVINEAGTGVYREVLQYLEAIGFVTLPELPKSGPFGETRYDSHPSDWEVRNGEVRFDSDGNQVVSFEARLYAPRGLRASDYENEYTKTGRTRYFR
jgi:hypothetical protein